MAISYMNHVSRKALTISNIATMPAAKGEQACVFNGLVTNMIGAAIEKGARYLVQKYRKTVADTPHEGGTCHGFAVKVWQVMSEKFLFADCGNEFLEVEWLEVGYILKLLPVKRF